MPTEVSEVWTGIDHPTHSYVGRFFFSGDISLHGALLGDAIAPDLEVGLGTQHNLQKQPNLKKRFVFITRLSVPLSSAAVVQEKDYTMYKRFSLHTHTGW